MFVVAVIACAALGFLAGRFGDDSMRDPLVLLVFVAWLASIAAVLYLPSSRWRRGGGPG